MFNLVPLPGRFHKYNAKTGRKVGKKLKNFSIAADYGVDVGVSVQVLVSPDSTTVSPV